MSNHKTRQNTYKIFELLYKFYTEMYRIKELKKKQ